jgi:hypothetical protein
VTVALRKAVEPVTRMVVWAEAAWTAASASRAAAQDLMYFMWMKSYVGFGSSIVTPNGDTGSLKPTNVTISWHLCEELASFSLIGRHNDPSPA